jgi:hypothetical protein
MSLSSPLASPEAIPSPPRGSLAFQGLWLFSPKADAAFLALPLGIMLVAALFTNLGDIPEAHRLAIWSAQNILGNGTHVILTFLLFAVHRDVLKAEPKQPRLILWGCIGMLGVSAVFFGTYYLNRDGHFRFLAVLFNVLGLHHTLGQHRGFWSLHGLRASLGGLGSSSPKERPLQQMYVPLMLTLVLVRLLFIPDSDEPGATPYIDVGQGALLPHWVLGVLIAVWLGYFLKVFRAVLDVPTASGPKVLYLSAVAAATGLVFVAPQWANVVLPGMHGVEYYMLTAKMMEPREGDAPSKLGRVWIWPAMILSMLPFLALGLYDFVMEGRTRGTLVSPDAGAETFAHPLLHATICLSLGVVLAHYFADALIYRFRIPSIRNVMLRRMGFVLPPAPGSTPRS